MVGRCAYFLLNILHNTWFPNMVGHFMETRDFRFVFSDEEWQRTNLRCSPSRKLSDFFWMKLPWEDIRQELGEIHVLDTGCGSGNYALRLQSFSGGRISGYTGMDICSHANWKRLMAVHEWINLKVHDSVSISPSIPEQTNLIISQSAIEHFEEDISYFLEIRKYIENAQRDVIQIHLFPSSSCLFLYLLHGVRQYTPRSAATIARLFKKYSYAVLYRLGGKSCNKLHFNYITKPLLLKMGNDFRQTRQELYDLAMKESIRRDMESKDDNSASFYALVIHSNWSQKICSNVGMRIGASDN